MPDSGHGNLPIPRAQLKHDPIVALANPVRDPWSIQLTIVERERIVFHFVQDSADEPPGVRSQASQLRPRLIIKGDLEAHR